MNRRDFFKAVSVAPVAVPVALNAAMQQAASTVAPGVIGTAWVGEPIRKAVAQTVELKIDTSGFRCEMDSLLRSMRSMRSLAFCEGDPSVEAQMREHDLFDLEPAPASL